MVNNWVYLLTRWWFSMAMLNNQRVTIDTRYGSESSQKMLSSTSASWKTHLAFTNPLSARSSGVVHGLQNIGAANQVSVCQSFFVAFVSSERHLQIPRNHGNHGQLSTPRMHSRSWEVCLVLVIQFDVCSKYSFWLVVSNIVYFP